MQNNFGGIPGQHIQYVLFAPVCVVCITAAWLHHLRGTVEKENWMNAAIENRLLIHLLTTRLAVGKKPYHSCRNPCLLTLHRYMHDYIMGL